MCVLQLRQHLAGSPAGPPGLGCTISTGSIPLLTSLHVHLKPARRNQEPKVQIQPPQRLL